MNKTIAIAAIAMFAVILGMSAIAPAMASEVKNDRAWYCHADSDGTLKVVKAGKKSGHLDHELDLGPFTSEALALAACPPS